ERLRQLASVAPTGETFGLLGSAAKARVEAALAAREDPGEYLHAATAAYLEGFRLDPGDYYPGIVALALLRVHGDLAQARELLPVVRFAATRQGEPTDEDVWRLATVAELNLHDALLHDNPAALAEARRLYHRVAAVATPNQRNSVARQLRMLRDAGDPPEL